MSQSFYKSQINGGVYSASKPKAAYGGLEENQQTITDLPEISTKGSNYFDNQKRIKSSHQKSGMRSTKTFLTKQEEKVLDLSNIPNVMNPDILEEKFNKIKKLKEEFKEIKT